MESIAPLEFPDFMREGMPNLRHGTVHKHPLEVQLESEVNAKESSDFNSTAALFGIGFAKLLRRERKIVGNSLHTYMPHRKPTDLPLQLSNGDIDDIDFGDFLSHRIKT